MAQRQLTQDEKDTAAALNMTEEQFLASMSTNELQAGTYQFKIAGGTVATITRDNAFNRGAIEANLRLVPVDSDGNEIKRFGSVFKRITLAVANEGYVPTDKDKEIGLSNIRWLATASKKKMAEVINEIKGGSVTDLIGATLVGRYVMKPSKKDPTKAYPEVYPELSAKPKLTTLSPDKSKANDGSAAF